MDFSDERYVRLFTRDTATWVMILWQGQCTLMQLLRRVDRAGVFEFGADGPISGLAAVTRMPYEVVDFGLSKLTEHEVVMLRGRWLIVTKFLEAQEAKSSDAVRKQESRARRANVAHRESILRGEAEPAENDAASRVYIVERARDGAVRISYTNILESRLAALSQAYPEDTLRLVADFPGGRAIAGGLHHDFRDYRIDQEWFRADGALASFLARLSAEVQGARDVGVTKRDMSRNVTVMAARSLAEAHEISVTNRDPDLLTSVTQRDILPKSTCNIQSNPVTLCLAVPSRADLPSGEDPSGPSAPPEEGEVPPKSNNGPGRRAKWDLPVETYWPSVRIVESATKLGISEAGFADLVGRFREHAEEPRVQTQAAFDSRILGWVKREPERRQSRAAPPAAPKKTAFGTALDRALFDNLDDFLAD